MNGSGLLIVRFPELSWDNQLHYSAFEKEARASVLIVEVLIRRVANLIRQRENQTYM